MMIFISARLNKTETRKYSHIFDQPFSVIGGTVPVKSLLSSHIRSRVVLLPNDGGIVPEKVLFDRYKLVNDGRLKRP